MLKYPLAFPCIIEINITKNYDKIKKTNIRSKHLNECGAVSDNRDNFEKIFR